MDKLIPDQERQVTRARRFLAAAAHEDRAQLAVFLGEPVDTDHDYLRACALGAARAHIGDLLRVIDSLTGGAS